MTDIADKIIKARLEEMHPAATSRSGIMEHELATAYANLAKALDREDREEGVWEERYKWAAQLCAVAWWFAKWSGEEIVTPCQACQRPTRGGFCLQCVQDGRAK